VDSVELELFLSAAFGFEDLTLAAWPPRRLGQLHVFATC